MSVEVQLLRGETADNDGLTAPVGVLTADTEARNLRLHNGTTAGGFRVGGPVVIDRVTSGLSHTVTIKGAKTQVVWASATSGAKGTTIPGASAAIDGCELGIATTLGNGDAHTITPGSGTIQGASTFTFTDTPRSNLSLVCDGAGTDWIIT